MRWDRDVTGATLLIQQPNGSIDEVELGDRTLLGRAAECDVVLPGHLVSRQHAVIERSGATYTIRDLGSRNGTTVNGDLLHGPRTLRDGDLIALGGVGQIRVVDNDATYTRPAPPARGVWIDVAAQDVWIDRQRLQPPLSPAQLNLLSLLIDRHDQVCSRNEIVAAVWPDAVDGVSDEAIDALIKRVRARLAEVPGGEQYLVTLRGRGVMLRSQH